MVENKLVRRGCPFEASHIASNINIGFIVNLIILLLLLLLLIFFSKYTGVYVLGEGKGLIEGNNIHG